MRTDSGRAPGSRETRAGVVVDDRQRRGVDVLEQLPLQRVRVACSPASGRHAPSELGAAEEFVGGVSVAPFEVSAGGGLTPDGVVLELVDGVAGPEVADLLEGVVVAVAG